MSASQSEEKFNYPLYKSLLSTDQEIIDEYIPKMSAGEINSFMRRFIEHYPLEAEKEYLEVNEDTDSIMVFENSNISKTDSLNNFINNFISSTNSSDEINAFFVNEDNFNYVVKNPSFYKNSVEVFHHITKHFHLSKLLRQFLENQKELNSFIWEGFRAYFENKKLYRGDIYPYIGSVVNRKLRQDLEVGFVCPFCSTYYIRDNFNKAELINCVKCQNRFSFMGVKCPTDGCGKIVPITSIDINIFDKNNVKHLRAFRALGQYLKANDLKFISEKFQVSNQIDAYKIPISAELEKKKLQKLIEYNLSDDAATSVPEFLFYLPLMCPITTGHTKAKHVSYGKKYDAFKGCGKSFILKDGLRKALKDGYFVYRLYDQRRIRYIDQNKLKKTYDDNIFIEHSQIDNFIDNKIPYDRINQKLNSYFSASKVAKDKPTFYLLKAFNRYFAEEYDKSIDFAIKTYMHDLTQDDFQYLKNFENYKNDSQLQNNLYYKNPPAYRIGWIPDNNIQERVRELYIDLVQDREDLIRKVTDAKLPMRFYTYRIDGMHGRSIHKKRIGIVLDKMVLPATKRASAGYGPNFKMDKKFISVKLMHNNETTELTPFVKNGVYWSPENASLHNFDNKTGIIWFDGKCIDEKRWEFPSGLVLEDNTDVIVNAICAPDSFSKMFQRFDFNGKMREIVSELETEGYI